MEVVARSVGPWTSDSVHIGMADVQGVFFWTGRPSLEGGQVNDLPAVSSEACRTAGQIPESGLQIPRRLAISKLHQAQQKEEREKAQPIGGIQ